MMLSTIVQAISYIKKQGLPQWTALAYRVCFILLLEVAVVETLEAATVASLILCHLVNCVVDSIVVVLLCKCCDAHLVCTSAALSVHTLLEVGLCIPYAVAQELSKL